MRARKSVTKSTSWKFILVHPAIWFLLATGALLYLGKISWANNRDYFLDHEKFQLTKSKLVVSECPSWANRMLDQSIESFVADEHSLLDPQLVSNALGHWSKLPWIRRIDSLEKSVAGMDVNLSYRVPVAMIDPIHRKRDVIRQKPLAVDGDGIVFDDTVMEPSEVARIQNRLIRINMPNIDLRGSLPWHAIADARIIPASQLAEFLVPYSQQFELYRVITRSLEKRRIDANPQFELWTSNGTTLIWGSAPGNEKSGEASPEQKVKAIQEYIARFGNLKEFKNHNSHAIDVTTGKPVVVKYKQIASKNSWLQVIK